MPTYIDDIGTSGQHGFGMLDRLLRLQVQSTVGEGIRRDVQNAHDIGTLPEVARLVAQDELRRGVLLALESLLQRRHERLQDWLLLSPQAADEGGRAATEQIHRGPLSSSRAVPPVPWTLLVQPVDEDASHRVWHGEELAHQPSVTLPEECFRGRLAHTGQFMGNQGIVALG